MFEAQLKQGVLLKKAIDAIRDIVSEANFDCSPSGLSMQSMDRANVVLVVLQLKASAFDTFRCDRNVALGVSMGSMSKIMKCGKWRMPSPSKPMIMESVLEYCLRMGMGEGQ